jgi:anthranilate synthase/aminodeoxychorismate synthase-like glutamine amidotransferase
MRLLFLENEDSFSWNVLDALPFAREQIEVRRGREIAGSLGELGRFDAVLLGPGPTDPVRAGLVGIVEEAARRETPLLGICLGFQAIGLAFGARLERCAPMHGKQSTVEFRASRAFPHFLGAQRVMRYHSLALAGIAPPLQVVASTADGIAMAVEHESLPIAGLQFHPDSYATERGREMLADFFAGLP